MSLMHLFLNEVKSSLRYELRLSSRDLDEQVFWTLASLLGFVYLVLSFDFFGEPAFFWILGCRLAYVVGALLSAQFIGFNSLIAISTKQRVSCSFMMVALALQASQSIVEGTHSIQAYQYTSVFVFFLTYAFRGDLKEWRGLYLPFALLFISFPLFFKSQDLLLALDVWLLWLSNMVLLVLGDLWVQHKSSLLRRFRILTQLDWAAEVKRIMLERFGVDWEQLHLQSHESLERSLAERSLAEFQEVLAEDVADTSLTETEIIRKSIGGKMDTLEKEMQASLSVLRELSQIETEMSPESRRLMKDAILRLQSVAFRNSDVRADVGADVSSDGVLSANRHSVEFDGPVLSMNELIGLLKAIWTQKDELYSIGKKRRVEFVEPKFIDQRIVVSVNASDITKIVDYLMERGVHSLGGGLGVVRLQVQAGLRSVMIVVEDNGRGMTDDQARLALQKGVNIVQVNGLTVPHIKAMLQSVKGQFDVQSRLGVGTRFELQLQRVDGFAVYATHQADLPASSSFHYV